MTSCNFRLLTWKRQVKMTFAAWVRTNNKFLFLLLSYGARGFTVSSSSDSWVRQMLCSIRCSTPTNVPRGFLASLVYTTLVSEVSPLQYPSVNMFIYNAPQSTLLSPKISLYAIFTSGSRICHSRYVIVIGPGFWINNQATTDMVDNCISNKVSWNPFFIPGSKLAFQGIQMAKSTYLTSEGRFPCPLHSVSHFLRIRAVAHYQYTSGTGSLIWTITNLISNFFLQVACVTVAALMQYFFMAALCWMLVEGIYLYLFTTSTTKCQCIIACRGVRMISDGLKAISEKRRAPVGVKKFLPLPYIHLTRWFNI